MPYPVLAPFHLTRPVAIGSDQATTSPQMRGLRRLRSGEVAGRGYEGGLKILVSAVQSRPCPPALQRRRGALEIVEVFETSAALTQSSPRSRSRILQTDSVLWPPTTKRVRPALQAHRSAGRLPRATR